MKNINLSLPSIHCESCVKLIKTSFIGIDGISELNIDLDKKSGEVKFDESIITQDKILQLIKEEAGYEVSIINK